MTESSQISRVPDRSLAHVLAAETLVGIVIGAVIIPTIIWFLDVPPPTELLGKHGVILGLFMGTLFQVLGTGIAVTLILRKRVQHGSLRALEPLAYPWTLRLPQGWLLRALLITACALVILAPAGLATCALFHLYPLSKPQFATLNSIYGAVVAILVTPVVAVAALCDGRSAASERKPA